MATVTVTPGYNWVSGEVVTPAKMNLAAAPTASVSAIVDADVAAGAAIALSKLATGALPTAITVASANLSNASVTAPKLQNGVSLQTVYASKSAVQSLANTIPYDNTIPQNTEGEELFTASITPSSATNKVLIEATITGTQANTGTLVVALFRGSGADAIATTIHSFTSGFGGQVHIGFQDSPATTSATTYRVRAGYVTGGSGFYMNANGTGGALFGGTLFSWMKLTEIKAS
jgi:hypothetical protein